MFSFVFALLPDGFDAGLSFFPSTDNLDELSNPHISCFKEDPICAP